MKTRSALLMVALAMPALPALADEPATPGPRLVFDESIGLSVNRLGLQHVLDLRRVWPLTSSRAALFADASVSAGISHSLTPSYTRLGGWVEVAPLSIFGLRVGAEKGAYFGTFGSLMSFDAYQDPFDDAARDMRKEEARAGSGSRTYVSPRLRMKMGRFAAASTADLEWWRSSAAGPLYYEPARDTLLEVDGGRALTVSTVVLRQHDLSRGEQLSYGLSHSLTHVFAAPANRVQRVGVVVVRQFGPKRFGLRAPRVAGQVAYYLSDPSRRGQLTASLGLSMGLNAR